MDHQDIDSEEEAYKKFIVICENGSESGDEKENSPEKQFKTNRQQFQMMTDFTNDKAEGSVGKVEFDKQWDKLAVDLNQIGPPKRTSMEWRRVWSVYKYNKKRKRSQHSESNAPESIADKASGESKSPNDRKSSARKSSGTKLSARKKSALGSGSITLGNSSSQDSPRNINDCVAAVQPVTVVQPSVCDRIVAQLDVLTGKQDDILRNQVAIIGKIDKSNEFLEGILKKP